MKNDLYLRAASCETTERPPLWMMRQAGRYLPEYRKIRETSSFLEMMKTPDIATEVTLQPIRRFGMDAAILFSDILVTAEALGSELDFVEKKGPVISNPVRDIDNSPLPVMSEVAPYVFETIRNLKQELDIPLLGFCGAPFTVASYMVEGGSSPDLRTVKTMIGNQPEILASLLDRLTQITIDYLNEQIRAGVNGLQIFDTWAGHLSYQDFQTYSLAPITRIIEGLDNPNNIPVTVYSRQSSTFAPLFMNSGVQVVSLDWQCDISQMKDIIRPDVAIQGNLDPLLLLASKEELTKRVTTILDTMKDRPGFIFNLGHGVIPQIDPEHVKLVVDLVQGYK